MFGSSILEVAIGMIFIYLFLSLVSSAVNEAIASFLNKRGKKLFEGVKNLLNDPKFTGLAQQLFTHGLVDGISEEATNPKKANRFPSYMPPSTFSLALIDILGSRGAAKSWQGFIGEKQKELDDAKAKLAAKPGDADLQKLVDAAQAAFDKTAALQEKASAAETAHAEATAAAKSVKGPKDLTNLQKASAKLQAALALGRPLSAAYHDPLGNIQTAVESLPRGHTKESLLVLIDKTKREVATASNQVVTAERQVERLRENLEEWFNDTMDRVGGWYKRWTQKILLAVAFVLVFGVNADTFMLAKRFMRDNALRAGIVSAAEKATQANAPNPTENNQARQELLKVAENLKLPLGWVRDDADPYKTEQIPDHFLGWLLKLLGLVISVFAVSLGAPFWFDTLSKFINIRSAGTPPGESKKGS